VQELFYQSFPRHESHDFPLVSVTKAYPYALTSMIHPGSESQRGIPKILETKPTDFIPEAVLKIVTQRT
jgi:hypothetical protein